MRKRNPIAAVLILACALSACGGAAGTAASPAPSAAPSAVSAAPSSEAEPAAENAASSSEAEPAAESAAPSSEAEPAAESAAPSSEAEPAAENDAPSSEAEPAPAPAVSAPSEAAPAPAPAASVPAADPRQTALSYVGRSAAELAAAIGQPNSTEYASSCIGDGEDGIMTASPSTPIGAPTAPSGWKTSFDHAGQTQTVAAPAAGGAHRGGRSAVAAPGQAPL